MFDQPCLELSLESLHQSRRRRRRRATSKCRPPSCRSSRTEACTRAPRRRARGSYNSFEAVLFPAVVEPAPRCFAVADPRRTRSLLRPAATTRAAFALPCDVAFVKIGVFLEADAPPLEPKTKLTTPRPSLTRREVVLGRLNTLVKQFVYRSSLSHGLTEAKAREACVARASPPSRASPDHAPSPPIAAVARSSRLARTGSAYTGPERISIPSASSRSTSSGRNSSPCSRRCSPQRRACSKSQCAHSRLSPAQQLTSIATGCSGCLRSRHEVYHIRDRH